MSDAPTLSHLDDPELDRVLRAQRIARWKKATVAVFLVVVVPAYLIIKFGPLIGLAFTMRALDGMPGPQIARGAETAVLVAFAREFRPAPDAGTSREAAGHALHAMLNWSGGELSMLRPRTAASENRLLPALADTNPTGLAPSRWSRELLPLAARGLTPAQRAYLTMVAAAGGDTLFRIFARAGGVDVIGTRYTFSPAFPQPGGSMILPIPYTTPLWRAVYARYARAALAVASHRIAPADSAVDEILGAGLLLWDAEPEFTSSLSGVRMVRSSLRARAAIDSLAGDSVAARMITGFLDSLDRSNREDPFFARQPTVGQEFDALPTLLARGDLPTSLRWTIVRHVVVNRATRFCVGLSDSADWRAWAEPARAALAHTKSDSLFFDWIAHPPSRAECKAALKKDPTP